MAMMPVDMGSGGGSKESSSSGGRGGNNRPPMQHLEPKSYEDILKFSVENTVPGEGGSLEPLSEERKKWLGQALSGMFTDEIKIMQKKLEELAGILNSSADDDVERKQILLENILDLCGSIDNARDFIKVGGNKVLVPCLDDTSSEVRWRALDIAATILQNNPFVQNKMLEEKLMQKFQTMADEDASDLVRIKAIYALSCHVREHHASGAAFVKSDGFSCLMRAMQRNHQKLQIKAAFLLKALLISQPEFKDGAQQVGMVPQLIGLLNTEHSTTHEHIVAALLCLVTDHPMSLADCKQPQVKLQEFLEARIVLLKDKEEFQEEHEYCEELLTTVFGNHDNTTAADR